MRILHYKISLPKSPNQPRQRTVLTLPDNNVLRLCAVRLHDIYGVTKHWLQCLRWDGKSLYAYSISL